MPLNKDAAIASEQYRDQRKQWLDLADARLGLTALLRQNRTRALTIRAQRLDDLKLVDPSANPVSYATTLKHVHENAFDAAGLWIDASLWQEASAAEQADMERLLAVGVPTLPIAIGFNSLTQLARVRRDTATLRMMRSHRYEPGRAPVMATYQGYDDIAHREWGAGISISARFLGKALLLDARPSARQDSAHLTLINQLQWAAELDKPQPSI